MQGYFCTILQLSLSKEREEMKRPKLKLITDFSEARWVQESLYPREEQYHNCLGSYIPVGFESYIAIRHENNDPKLGTTIPLNFEKLILLIRDFTETPDTCFVGIWNGFGWNLEREFPELFKNLKPWKTFEKFFKIPDRKFYLMQTEILDTLKIGHFMFNNFNYEKSNLLWPSDRNWFVVNEIDFDVTLVGGSEQMICEIENCWDFVTERFDPTVKNKDIFIADLDFD